MFRWIPYAMVRVALFFSSGILLAIYQPELLSTTVVVSTIVVFSVTYLISYFFLKRNRLLLGVMGLGIVSLLGFLHLTLRTEIRREDHLTHVKDTVYAYTGIVRSYPQSKSKSWKLELEVTAVKIKTAKSWQLVTGRVQVYISKKENELTWRYGDHVLVMGAPQLLTPPANPGEFDFKRFLTFRNIHHQQFLRKGDFLVLQTAEQRSFIYYSHRARMWATEKIQQFVKEEQEQAIAMALILGVTDGIDTDLVNAYSASGAMHVLAVSGLHVGIIYALILFLLKPLRKHSWSRWTIAVISLVCLWSFAFVTGLSPSVLRAVTMFSFVAVARPFGIRTNIYNTLAASAFALLLYNPYLIMSVGFQLSYLAVIGIVSLQRPIYLLLEFDSWLGNWVWQITCISIAAQLTTFSLGLLYFHQFPVYFLISNLFVIPLSTFILVGGILLLLVQFISPVASFVGIVVEGMIKLLNWIVFTVEEMPYSLVNNIELSTFQCWLLMAILASIILLLERKSLRWLYLAMAISVLFSITQWIHFRASVNRTQMIVYQVNGHSAIDFIHHGKVIFLTDSILRNDNERIRFHIRPNRLLSGVQQIDTTVQGFRKNGVRYFSILDKTIAIVDSPNYELPISGTIDFLIISNNARPLHPINDLIVHHVIVDSSNTRWRAKQWSTWAGNLPMHDVSSLHAFVVTL